jgi:hypothetical protein
MKHQILTALREMLGIHQMHWELEDQINKMRLEILSEQRRNELWNHILNDTASGVTSTKYTHCEIIVSLTSYSKRMLEAALAIESIMQQTMKANRIVLWLAHEDYKHIPQSLRMLQKRGLEIMECDDLLSYKKIIPSLRQFPEDVLITIDDDVFYSPDVLENLISAYLEAPQHIHCLRAHRVKTDANGIILPYKQWEWCVSEKGPNRRNFFTGCGGVLYPPHCLDEEVLNEPVFMKICKHADDVWLNAMALKKGTLVNIVMSNSKELEGNLFNERIQSSGLYYINVENEGLNDAQLRAIFEKYSLYEKLQKNEN